MQIRKMTIDDYEQVYDIWKNTLGIGLHDYEDSKTGIDKFKKRNPNTCFVSEENKNIIGVVLCGHNGRKGEINHLAVNLSNRREGIGTILVKNVLNALKEEGITRVSVLIFEDNKTGNKFWNKMGFSERDDLIYRIKELKRI